MNGHLPAKYLLSAAAQSCNVPVVLSGEGADELFLGYPHFMIDAALQSGNSTEQLTRSLTHTNPTARGLMLSAGCRDAGLPHFYQTKVVGGERLRDVFHPTYAEALSKGSLSLQGNVTQANRLHISRTAWVDLALSNYILRTLGDGTEMAHGIEGRTPFLDHILWEGLADIPLESWLEPSFGGGKSILRDAVAGFVPEQVRQQPKRPFMTPPLELDPATPGGELAWELSLEQTAPFFSRSAVEQLLRDLTTSSQERRKDFDPTIFTIITANCAWKHFVEGGS